MSLLLTNYETDAEMPSMVAVQGADRHVVAPGGDLTLDATKGQITLTTEPADPTWPHAPEISIGIKNGGNFMSPTVQLHCGKSYTIKGGEDYNFPLDRARPMTLALASPA